MLPLHSFSPATKCAQWLTRLGCETSIQYLVDLVTPNYAAPVARDLTTPGPGS